MESGMESELAHLGRDVVVKRNALTAEQCDLLIDLYTKNPKFQKLLDKNQGAYTNNTNYCSFHVNKKMFPNAFNLIQNQMIRYLQEYKDFCGINCDLGGVYENFEFMVFKKDAGKFEQHIDSNGTSHSRTIAFIWYLNDMEDGGELHMPSAKAPLKITPEKGKLIMFPTDWTHYHYVTTPKSSNRFSINTFLRYS